MCSFKGRRLCNLIESKASAERSEFRRIFPAEAPLILESLERIISRVTKEAVSVGRTENGTEIFELHKAIRAGKDDFFFKIVFEVDEADIPMPSATWINFRWERRARSLADALIPGQTLKDILDSLRAKDFA